MHIIVAHLDSALKLTRRGLGADSEQALEVAHHDFDAVWERYITRDFSNVKYGERLLKAVLTYNASHTPITSASRGTFLLLFVLRIRHLGQS